MFVDDGRRLERGLGSTDVLGSAAWALGMGSGSPNLYGQLVGMLVEQLDVESYPRLVLFSQSILHATVKGETTSDGDISLNLFG